MNSNTLVINGYSEEVMRLIEEDLELAPKSLSRELLEDYSDILMVDFSDDLQEFRKKIELFYSTIPNQFKHKILYIPELDKCSEYMQNALLKFIEDDNDKCICVAQAQEIQNVLSTVRSRMQIMDKSKVLGFGDFSDYCMKHMIGQDKLYFDVTGGNIGKIKDVGKQIGLWKDLQALLPKRENMQLIFQKLHIVREKDKQCFTETSFDLLELLINTLQATFFAMLSQDIDNNWETAKIEQNIAYCEEEFQKVKKKTYKGKDLTFFLIKLYQ